jgi:azurin
MRFQETTLVAPPATAVTLVFENTASRPSMQHNVVLLREPPTQALFQRVGEAAARAPDHVPDLPVVLAATPLSRPGETVSVTFTTPPAPGNYGYVCTYPGHWVTMQGTLRVEPLSTATICTQSVNGLGRTVPSSTRLAQM